MINLNDDVELLRWFNLRLIEMHREPENMGYMLRLREVADKLETMKLLLQDVRRLILSQREYFKTKDLTLLRNCKAGEADILRRIEELIPTKPKAPSLFDQIDEHGGDDETA